MVSSTFTDLKVHRAALIRSLNEHDLHPNVMEYDGAKPAGDVIDSSLNMVRDSAAYILLISLKYGQIPADSVRNPDKLSITELEFNEAQRLRRPILLFIMGDRHPVTKTDIERDPVKEAKLDAFRERAKKATPGALVNRVYSVFETLDDFKDKINSPLAELGRHLDSLTRPATAYTPPPTDASSTIPRAPAFYAEPDYIGSHQFVGRQAELDALSDWANRSDPTNLLLFEAIGGNGKSMLTWEWTTKFATEVRSDWAGRFWYSFYERGAIMQDFCQRALAYMTGRSLKDFEKRKTAEMQEELIAHLHARPWLLILDGLERVLVAFHRIDAAEVPDEEANVPCDIILNRNPCDTIRDEDSDLIRALAACTPSKILVSSRITPRTLLNQAGQSIPGAKRMSLLGLRPADAEKLLRSCGIEGDSEAIQDYLQQNCDNHPLVIGVLAGLIANYLPDRRNFDAWSNDIRGGAALDLAKLDLTQRRNHILHSAINALSDASHQLISTLALLSESVDYKTLDAFNPHMPPEPEAESEPEEPQKRSYWQGKKLVSWKELGKKSKVKLLEEYKALKSARREKYMHAVKKWRELAEVRDAARSLAETVHDLEQRGLLQYDRNEKRYDLHPVVRGVVAGKMTTQDKEYYGLKVVDHFSIQPHKAFQEVEDIDDLRPALGVVQTLLRIGRVKEAAKAFRNTLAEPLLFNLEAYVEAISMLHPFFLEGWSVIPASLDMHDAYRIMAWAATTLDRCGEIEAGFEAESGLMTAKIKNDDLFRCVIDLGRFSRNFRAKHMLAKSLHLDRLAVEMASASREKNDLFMSALFLMDGSSVIGDWDKAETTWDFLNSLGREFPRSSYRPGDAELYFCRFKFWRETVQEHDLDAAEQLAIWGRNRTALRSVISIRGKLSLSQKNYVESIVRFQEAVRMARERRIEDSESETGLALAKFQLSLISNHVAQCEAERLAQLRQPAYRYLAMLWLAIGDHEQAKVQALQAYKWAWADGEPYVHRYELTKTIELLQQMSVALPELPPYDQKRDESFPWELEVRAAINKLKAERASR